MQSPLDGSDYWFLRSIVLHENLRLTLEEGKTSTQEEWVTDKIHAKRVEITKESRIFLITFEHPIAWQVLDESYVVWDNYEVGDTGPIRTLTRSRYLDYLTTTNQLMDEDLRNSSHYRICGQDEIVDVLTTHPPIIELLNKP